MRPLKPLVEIRRIASNAYAYTVRASSTTTPGTDSGAFATLTMCLRDAGAALGQYFPQVELNFEGRSLGVCDTEALRRNPKALAARLQLTH